MTSDSTVRQDDAMKVFWAAFVAAQKDLRNVGFDSKNPHYKNEYASLAACLDAIRPVFNRHGFALFQTFHPGERGPIVKTLLGHESGVTVEFGCFEVPAAKLDAQGWAGASTYGRRYSLLAMAGVTGDYDDDDGEAAVAAPNQNLKTKGK